MSTPLPPFEFNPRPKRTSTSTSPSSPFGAVNLLIVAAFVGAVIAKACGL